MPSSWSPNRDATPEASRLIIERAHEELVAGNDSDERLQHVRPVVRESWQRAREMRIGTEAMPRLDLADEQLTAYRDSHPLARVIDTIRGLLLPGDASEAGVVLAVGDHLGRLLWVEGDMRTRLLTGDMGFVPGANWSEETVGTSAPGVALVTGESVQIRHAEHYNRLVQPWSCTAAPVFDPESRQLIGMVDVTGGAEAASPQARMLIDATVRAAEAELLVARLRDRSEKKGATPPASRNNRTRLVNARLRVLGRDRARLEIYRENAETAIDLSARHAAIMLLLAINRQGLSAERLAALVYGETGSVDTIRPEMVRLRKVLEPIAPELVPDARPYRLVTPVEIDAQNVINLLTRGAHRVALAEYSGPVLPESTSPGVEEYRESVRAALHEAIVTEASVDVMLAYSEIPEGQADTEVLRLCLELLPARSPKRPAIVARIERLEGS